MAASSLGMMPSLPQGRSTWMACNGFHARRSSAPAREKQCRGKKSHGQQEGRPGEGDAGLEHSEGRIGGIEMNRHLVAYGITGDDLVGKGARGCDIAAEREARAVIVAPVDAVAVLDHRRPYDDRLPTAAWHERAVRFGDARQDRPWRRWPACCGRSGAPVGHEE